MGLATLPSPSEGVLCVILVNSSIPFSIFKHIVRILLLIIGVRLNTDFTSPDEPSDEVSHTTTYRIAAPDSYIEEFRTRTPGVRFKTICTATGTRPNQHECPVCLVGFELESEINQLSCGHVFHKECLEQWLDYWNTTCPLCRTPVVTPEDDPCCPVW